MTRADACAIFSDMRALSPRSPLRPLPIILRAAGPLAAVAILVGVLYSQGNANAADDSEYVALGSSFGAGPGVATRAPNSPLACMRSADNYAHILARVRHLTFTDMTCIGATTKDVLEGGQDSLGP